MAEGSRPVGFKWECSLVKSEDLSIGYVPSVKAQANYDPQLAESFDGSRQLEQTGLREIPGAFPISRGGYAYPCQTFYTFEGVSVETGDKY